MRIALYEPDIPQNAGTILRMAACLGIEAHIIEPAGFPTTDRAFRRAGMDYLDQVALVRHASFDAFERWRRQEHARLILLTTQASTPYLDHAFRAGDVLLFGRESAGVPEAVHRAADARLVAVLVNPTNPTMPRSIEKLPAREQEVARSKKLEFRIVSASTEVEIPPHQGPKSKDSY